IQEVVGVRDNADFHFGCAAKIRRSQRIVPQTQLQFVTGLSAIDYRLMAVGDCFSRRRPGQGITFTLSAAITGGTPTLYEAPSVPNSVRFNTVARPAA